MPVMPKGRLNIRRTAVPGLPNQRTKLWELESKPGTIIARLEQAYLEGLAAVDGMEAARATIDKDVRFTEDGRRDEFRKHVLAQAVPTFIRGRKMIAQARKELADQRAKLQPPKADPADAATAIAKMEIRTWLRGLSNDERAKLTAPDVIEPAIRTAIVEAPSTMSGTSDERRALLLENVLRETHGSLIDEAAELAQAIEAAESVVTAGNETARMDMGLFEPGEFGKLVAPIEEKLARDIPWLRRGKVVDIDRGIERDPTSDELTVGIEAQTFDEYKSRRAA